MVNMRLVHIISVVLSILSGCYALCYPADHGPLHECDVLEVEESEKAEVSIKVYGKRGEPRVRVETRGRCVLVSLLNSNRRIMFGPQEISDWCYGLGPVSRADLNSDGIEDFIVPIWTPGCGTNFGLFDVCIIYSSGEDYEIKTLEMLFPGPESFVDAKDMELVKEYKGGKATPADIKKWGEEFDKGVHTKYIVATSIGEALDCKKIHEDYIGGENKDNW